MEMTAGDITEAAKGMVGTATGGEESRSRGRAQVLGTGTEAGEVVREVGEATIEEEAAETATPSLAGRPRTDRRTTTEAGADQSTATMTIYRRTDQDQVEEAANRPATTTRTNPTRRTPTTTITLHHRSPRRPPQRRLKD